MPSKLEQLKKEIQRLRPEIMELKFGCMVKILCDDSDFYGKEKPYWTKCPVITVSPKKAVITVLWHQPNSEVDIWNRVEAGEAKILGRPITLDDVLFCCVEVYSKFGIITKKSYEEMLGGVVGLWNFSKDFDNQSEEFYDEIMFLLQ